MISFLTKAILLYLGLLLLMFVFQRSLMYYPQYGNYDATQIPDNFQEVLIQVNDKLKIKGWLHKKNLANKKTVLYFHGNAGTINDRIYRLREFEKMDINFLIISYRGYSDNDGKPNEKGLCEDANAALKFLNELGVQNKDIFLYGESIGTGIVTQIAQNKNFAGIILEAPFTSAVDVAKKLYPIFPVSFLILDRYQSIDKIKNINSPILVIHGGNDKLIPLSMGKDVFAAANEPKYFLQTTDDHTIAFDDEVVFAIKEFFSKINH